MADFEGPTVIFKKSQIIKKDVTQLPILLSNSIPLILNNKAIVEAQPLPGIQNVHSSVSQLKAVNPIMSSSMTTFIKEQSPILPVEKSVNNVFLAENETI